MRGKAASGRDHAWDLVEKARGAIALANRGQLLEAEAMVEEAEHEAGRRGQSVFIKGHFGLVRAMLLWLKGQRVEGVDRLESVALLFFSCDQDEESARVLFLRAVCLLEMGEAEAAWRSLAEARALAPVVAETLILEICHELAVCALASSRFEHVDYWLEKAEPLYLSPSQRRRAAEASWLSGLRNLALERRGDAEIFLGQALRGFLEAHHFDSAANVAHDLASLYISSADLLKGQMATDLAHKMSAELGEEAEPWGFTNALIQAEPEKRWNIRWRRTHHRRFSAEHQEN